MATKTKVNMIKSLFIVLRLNIYLFLIAKINIIFNTANSFKDFCTKSSNFAFYYHQPLVLEQGNLFIYV